MRDLQRLLPIILSLAIPVSAQEGPDVAAAFEARITAVQGEVYIFGKDGEEGFPAQVDTPVEAGDRIETRDASRVELALEADSLMELGANTVLTVDSLVEEKSVFALTLGSLVAKFRAMLEKQRRYRVLTPTAVASVRGTEFGVEVGEEGDTTVGVYDEGAVAVSTRDESIDETLLGAQDETSVPIGKLDIQEKDGIRRLRRGKLSLLKKRRARMLALRGRQTELRKAWKGMAPEQRRALRQKIRERHLERFKNMKPEMRQKMMVRMKRRVLRAKIDRARHERSRKKMRERIRLRIQKGKRGPQNREEMRRKMQQLQEQRGRQREQDRERMRKNIQDKMREGRPGRKRGGK